MGVRMYFYRVEYTIRPYFSPVRQPNQLTWRKQKLVFNYQTSGNFSSLSFFFFLAIFMIHLPCLKTQITIALAPRSDLISGNIL